MNSWGKFYGQGPKKHLLEVATV